MAWGDDVFRQTTQKKTVNSTKNTFCPIPYWDYLRQEGIFLYLYMQKRVGGGQRFRQLCMFENTDSEVELEVVVDIEFKRVKNKKRPIVIYSGEPKSAMLRLSTERLVLIPTCQECVSATGLTDSSQQQKNIPNINHDLLLQLSQS